jgi:hypothetical protein
VAIEIAGLLPLALLGPAKHGTEAKDWRLEGHTTHGLADQG